MRRIDEKEIPRRTELLAKIEPAQESTDRAITRVRKALAAQEHKSETTSAWRKIMKSRWTKLAAAAVIIISIFIGVEMLSGTEKSGKENIAKQETGPTKDTVQKEVDQREGQLEERIPSRAQRIAAELAEAADLFAAGDVAGLVAMLEKNQTPTKTAVANYLAAIGDESALDALQKLSEQWEGEDSQNPFAAVVRLIEERAAKEVGRYGAQTKQERQGEWMEVRVVAKETGEAIPFVTISTYPASGGQMETDANGVCLLEFGGKRPDYLNLFASKEGWVSMSSHMRKDQALGVPKKFTFALEKGTVIGGIVQDPNGEPLEGVKVSVTVHENIGTDRATIDVRGKYETDAEGRWRCDIVPPVLDQVGLSFTCTGFAGTGFAGKSFWSKDLNMDALRSEAFVTTLERGITLTGYVYDVEGNSVKGASVLRGHSHQVSAPEYRAKTNEEGYFEFSDISGRRLLTVTAAGYAPQMKQVVMKAGMEPVEFVLETGYTIRGRVVDLQDKPVEGATVSADKWRGYQVIKWQVTSDSEGRFQWTDAPADKIEIDVSKKGFMEVDDAIVVASQAEYEFVLEQPIKVTGKVVDAKTGEPVEEFRLMPSYGRKTGEGTYASISWHRESGPLRTFARGEYKHTFSSDAGFYVIRIEADGYMPAESRKIERHEKNVIIDFELEKASGPNGVVKLAGGEPVEAAEVYLVTGHFYMQNGWVEGRDFIPHTRTDAEGKFSFKPQLDKFTFTVVCDEGFAKVSGEDFAQSGEIIVEPWATVVGDFYVGSQPAVNSAMRLDYPRMDQETPGYTACSTAITDANGAFVFEKVIPGEFRVSRDRFEVARGQTLEIHIGGDGRTVRGRFIAPDGFEGILEDEYRNINIYRRRPEIKEDDIPRAAGHETMSASELRQWLEEFYKSRDGKKWQSEMVAKYGSYGKPYGVEIGEGGYFSVDNIQPGNYFMKGKVFAWKTGRSRIPDYEKKLARVYFQFTVPEISEDAPIDENVELGDIQMLSGALEVGANAPAFEVDGLKEGKVRLSDYRGKVVLLSFYTPDAIKNSDEIQNLRGIYERFGGNSRFKLVGMVLTHATDYISAKLVEESQLEWMHGIAGHYGLYDSKEYIEYDVVGSQWNVLIGGDGKVLAIGVNGEELVTAVEAALEEQ